MNEFKIKHGAILVDTPTTGNTTNLLVRNSDGIIGTINTFPYSAITNTPTPYTFTGGTVAGHTDFSTSVCVGDQGTEGGSIAINNLNFNSSFKVSDIDGTNYAQTILHRHSTALEPVIVGARSNSDTTGHTNTVAGQNTFTIYGAGWNTSSYKLNGQISIALDDTGTFSNTSSPGKIVLSTTPDGSVWPVQAMAIHNDGKAVFANNISGTSISTPVIENNKDWSGFYSPNGLESLVQTYNSTGRTISITGTFIAYYKGQIVLNYSAGGTWTSSAHTASPVAGILYLKYNDAGFSWSQSVWDFSDMQLSAIAVNYLSTPIFGIRENHGLMGWQSHKELHSVIGTYKNSGADITGIVNNSTTAANRRPLVSAANVSDEDLTTIITALTAATYTQFTLSGAGATTIFNLGAAEMVPVLANNPYYNSFAGSIWGQTLFPNNGYGAIFLLGVPTTSDAGSQAYRYMWVQPQTVSTTLATIQAVTPSSLNLGNLPTISNEYVFLTKIIIRYTGGNWVVTSVENLTGSRYNQVATPSGSYLSSVSVDGVTVFGDGTISNPLYSIGGGSGSTATAVSYVPTTPLTGTNVQTALDELAVIVQTQSINNIASLLYMANNY